MLDELFVVSVHADNGGTTVSRSVRLCTLEVVLGSVGKEWLASTKLVSSDLEGDFGRISVGFVVPIRVSRLGQGSLVTEGSAKSHFTKVTFEIFVVDDAVRVVIVVFRVRALGRSFVVQVEGSGVSDHLSVGSNITAWVESIGAGSLEGIGLTARSVEWCHFSWSGVDSGNPEFSDNHTADCQGTGLVLADASFILDSTHLVGADILDTGQSFDSVHATDERISRGQVLRSSSKCKTDNGDQTGGQDRNGGGDSVGRDGQWDILEPSRSDDNEGDNTRGAEQEVGDFVELDLQRGGFRDTKENLAFVPKGAEAPFLVDSLGVESLSDFSNLCGHARAEDNSSGTSFCDLSSGKDETNAITEISVPRTTP